MSIKDINNIEYFVNHYNSLQHSKNNGRIDIVSNNFEPNLLSTLYFSEENIKTIHHSIMFGVYKMSNNTYKIGYQNEDTLKIVMRSIFLQHSKNQEYNITKQLEQLNKMVIDYCVNQIYNEAKGYMKFKSDVSNLAVPMNRPVSTYHSNNLEFKKFF